MVRDLDTGGLRELDGRIAVEIANEGSLKDVADRLSRVGLPRPPSGDSKPTRARGSLDAVGDEQLADIAQRMLARGIAKAAEPTAAPNAPCGG